MTEAEAIDLAQSYVASWGVPWRKVLKVQSERTWWILEVQCYTFVVDTGDGLATVSVDVSASRVVRMEYSPNDCEREPLPPWAAYPTFTCVTIGWRQSFGERFWIKWHSWYAHLTEDAKAEYRQKYPPPLDAERGWHDFYEYAGYQDQRITRT